jgi:hypothetical protein
LQLALRGRSIIALADKLAGWREQRVEQQQQQLEKGSTDIRKIQIERRRRGLLGEVQMASFAVGTNSRGLQLSLHPIWEYYLAWYL